MYNIKKFGKSKSTWLMSKSLETIYRRNHHSYWFPQMPHKSWEYWKLNQNMWLLCMLDFGLRSVLAVYGHSQASIQVRLNLGAVLTPACVKLELQVRNDRMDACKWPKCHTWMIYWRKAGSPEYFFVLIMKIRWFSAFFFWGTWIFLFYRDLIHQEYEDD